jgi:hypothetical protein
MIGWFCVEMSLAFGEWYKKAEWLHTILTALVFVTVFTLIMYGLFVGYAEMFSEVADVGGLVVWPLSL